jgi:hypothetical protein
MAEAFGSVFTYRPNGRAENAAGHGTPLVDAATAGRGVERGAGGFVGEVFKAGLIGGRSAERAGLGITGKIWAVLGEPRPGAKLEVRSERRICGAQSGHSFAEARRIEGVDGEGAVAALRATDATDEKVSGAAGGIGKRCVDDLDELGIAREKRHEGKDSGAAGETERLPACISRR